MAHFAQIVGDKVVRVIVVSNDTLGNHPFPQSEAVGVVFCRSLYGDTTWKQTSYSASFRKNFAGPGYTYDAQRDAFIPPQPFPEWLLDESTCTWVAPAGWIAPNG